MVGTRERLTVKIKRLIATFAAFLIPFDPTRPGTRGDEIGSPIGSDKDIPVFQRIIVVIAPDKATGAEFLRQRGETTLPGIFRRLAEQVPRRTLQEMPAPLSHQNFDFPAIIQQGRRMVERLGRRFGQSLHPPLLAGLGERFAQRPGFAATQIGAGKSKFAHIHLPIIEREVCSTISRCARASPTACAASGGM